MKPYPGKSAKRHLGLFTAALVLLFFVFQPAARAALSAAAPSSPQDFAHARTLTSVLEGALCRVTLPQFVYSGLIQSQQSDLAVFNADGEIVPFVVRAPSPVFDAGSRSDSNIPFFELPSEKGAEAGPPDALDVYVKTGPEGRIVTVTSGTKSASSNSRQYVLDFTSILSEGGRDEGIHQIELAIPEESRLAARLTVFQSDDLRDWSRLLSDVPLIQLRNNDSRLTRNIVDLPGPPRLYLLLQIENVNADFDLKRVGYTAVAHRRTRVHEEEETFEGQLSPDGRSVEYDLQGAFPISKLNFVLQEPGLYDAVFSSRPDRQSAWRYRGRMELSMIREPSRPGSASTGPHPVRMNDPVSTNGRENRYWKLDFDKKFSGLPPKMRISWRPSEVLFLAQGGGPYVLAFGSSQAGLDLQTPSLSGNGDVNATTAGIGSAPDFGQDAAARRPKNHVGDDDNAEWQRYLVWGLMVLGGLLLSFMAWRLMSGAEKNRGSR